MEGVFQAVEAAFREIIRLTSLFVIPDWGALIGLLPVGILLLVLIFFGWVVVRYRTAGPTRRGPGKVEPRAPDSIHMPGPSFAPVFAAMGAFLFFFGLFFGTSSIVFFLGLGALFATLLYWLREGMRDYDAIEAPASVPAIAYGAPPAGIHMPGPSFRPLLVSAAAAVLFAGLIVGPALLVGGILLLFITLVGWLGDAGREYHATAAGDHGGEAPPTYPIGTLVAFVVVLVVGLGLSFGLGPGGNAGGEATAGTGGSAAASPGAAAPSAAASTAPSAAPAPAADLVITALNIAYDVAELTIPAGAPFTIAFVNNDAGIPHNVAIHKETATGPEIYKGEIFNGVETRVYEVPALEAGAYAFVCTVHPNMVGKLTAQ